MLEHMLESQDDAFVVPRDSGEGLSSTVRAKAVVARALTQCMPGDARLPALIEALRNAAADAARHTTQENAAALRAVAAWTHLQSKRGEGRGTVYAHGASKTYAPGAPTLISWQEYEPVHAVIQPQGPGYAVLRVDGLPNWQDAGASHPVDTPGWAIGYALQGRDDDGDTVTEEGPTALALRQGELYTVTISGRVPSKVGNLLVSLMLPGGLEVEGPGHTRAVQGTTPTDGPLGTALEPDRVEARDDRLLLFRTRSLSGTFHHRVIVRAVTRGRFKVGRIRLEALYNPGQAATGAADTKEWREVHVRGE